MLLNWWSLNPAQPRKSSMQRIWVLSSSRWVNSAIWSAEAPRKVPTSTIIRGFTFLIRFSKTAPFEPQPLTLVVRRSFPVMYAGGKSRNGEVPLKRRLMSVWRIVIGRSGSAHWVVTWKGWRSVVFMVAERWRTVGEASRGGGNEGENWEGWDKKPKV